MRQSLPPSRRREIDWPEPTCTVDYKPQSDTVSCEFVEETGDAPAKLVYTIQEGAEGDQILELSKLADAPCRYRAVSW